MRHSQLNQIRIDWDDRSLFRKRRRWVRNTWLLVLVTAGAALFYQRNAIPDLLLGGFKVIAHAIPAQQTASVQHPSSLN